MQPFEMSTFRASSIINVRIRRHDYLSLIRIIWIIFTYVLRLEIITVTRHSGLIYEIVRISVTFNFSTCMRNNITLRFEYFECLNTLQSASY
jgi:hypothetical protein